MSRPIKTLCAIIPKNKLEEITVKMQCCEWEKEILLELYAEPKLKTVESLVFSTKDNYLKRVNDLERRIVSYLASDDVLLQQYYKNMFFFLLSVVKLPKIPKKD